MQNIKYQISNIQTENVKIFKFLVCVFDFWILIFGFAGCAYAKEITILYTGDTHAMLYPCNCPKELDGGVARRASLIKQLRRKTPNTLVLDSGGFFAGGLQDEYTQNTQLDTQRTIINLKAMELMHYDAVAVGDDEFNFGREFMEENISKTNLAFLSCNISPTERGGSANNFGGKSNRVLPYIIKEIAGTKIGIIGVTNLSVSQKAGGLSVIEPNIAVKHAVEQARRRGADIIVILSHLGAEDDSRLIEEVGGIDILIGVCHLSKEEPSGKIGSTLILRPEWQGRRLSKASLTITDNKISNYKIEELRLSNKIADDPDILSILPQCFSDNNCKKEGFVGICQQPGSLNSRCLFSEVTPVNLLIITTKSCITCDTETVIKFLKTYFPGLSIFYLYYPGTKAKKLIKDFNIKVLPAYLLGKEVEKEKAFASLRLRDNAEIKGSFYMLKPQFSGMAYFLGREEIKGKLDLFVSLYDKDAQELLGVMKGFNPNVHFLAIEQNNRFDAAKGNLEVEEYLRSICIQKYYPEYFWDYISCRAKNINSSWWEDCAPRLDTDKIKTCARGEEGKGLLKENISLNKELQIIFGPAYFINNQEVFGSKGVPTKEEFKKIFKK